jgi:hypothetical protein
MEDKQFKPDHTLSFSHTHSHTCIYVHDRLMKQDLHASRSQIAVME